MYVYMETPHVFRKHIADIAPSFVTSRSLPPALEEEHEATRSRPNSSAYGALTIAYHRVVARVVEPQMALLKPRAAASGQLSTTAIAAIVTGIGVVMLCLLVALIFLLVRAVKKHKQLLADLEERGVSIVQAQKEAGRESVTRPRTVLRRNTVLPFNKSGWGTLPSVETFRSAESSTTVPAHYVPPKPTEEVKRASRLSWPFSARRLSGHSNHSIQMKKIKVSRLSTVIEDPKPSPMVHVLTNSHLSGSRSSIALSGENSSRPAQCQSLLQYHPAFRNQAQDIVPVGPEIRANNGSITHTDPHARLQRAKSVAEVPSLQPSRPQLRARSVSLCSQTSGIAPDVILPPLPLDIARIKSDAKRRSQLQRAPSKLSISSFGSADTSILASRFSPVVPQSTKFATRKITKPNAKGSNFARAKPFRDTLDLRTKVLGGRSSSQSSPARISIVREEQGEVKVDNQDALSADSSTNSLGTSKGAQSGTLSKVSSPTASPLTAPTLTTPKRKLKTQISSSGSPERQSQSTTVSRSLTGAIRSPKRQHSQTSSRSSGGNPFQWDPTPISSTAKPSALKGSPSARQGHRRKNSVRISLVPTIHGPPSRTPSLSVLVDNKEDTTEGASARNSKTGTDLGFSSTRLLPTPPSSSTFAPDLKFTATSLRASLTSTSPDLPLVGYDQTYVVLPTDQVLPTLSVGEQKRLSNGSLFSLSQFPTAPSVIEPMDIDMSYPHTFPISQPYDFDGNWMPDTPLLQQYPFYAHMSDRDRSPSPIDIDEYNPEQPSCIYQTPANINSRAFQSAFATIPEESSISSNRTVDLEHSRYDDSPPVSPKTMSPPRFNLADHSVYSLPTHATVIPEEPLDTIDPAVLSKDAFNMLNGNYRNAEGSIFITPNSSRSSVAIPTMPGSARSMFDPLLEAALPSSPPNTCGMDSPTLAHLGTQSPSSSIYSSPSPSMSLTSWPTDLPSPAIPCSPRPGHAQLPTSRLSINFAEMPRLNPSPRGPRGSPPRPLRTSIAALRRMNSDVAVAEREKNGRGERRYLRLGRGDSLQLPGDESWLDELEDDDAVELDDVEGRRLVGNVLEGWEDEGCTMLDLEEGNTTTLSNSTIKPEPEQAKGKVGEADKTTGTESSSSSSIWEDGDKFWTSNTPPQPRPSSTSNNNNNLMNHYQPLESSPVLPTSKSNPSTPTSKSQSSRKRDFQVAKDDNPPSPTENSTSNTSPTPEHNKKPRESASDNNSNNSYAGNSRRSNASSRSHRKRRILGIGTPNVRIQVTSPGGQVRGTPGSLYDSQGFLIF
ncbi:Nn.00g082870.m01.CDS01 [Neocucurbitaria sp. VM-36]